jgi:hypothetical protein
MDLGAVVEVAIGLIFMWITLSLATIQIQEWISTILDKRARDMEASLHEMLANPNLKSQFYDHPVIRGLTANKRKRPSTVPAWFYRYPIVRGFTREKRKLPSYIPAQTFSLALFDIAMTAGTESSLIQQGILKIRDDFQKSLENIKEKPKNEAVIDALNILSELARSAAATEAGRAVTNYSKEVLKREVKRLSDRYIDYQARGGKSGDELVQIGEALKRALREATLIANSEMKIVKQAAASHSASMGPPTGNNEVDSTLNKLTEGVAALSVVSPELNQTLSTLFFNVEESVAEKEKQIARARGNLESWFNNSMDRVSGVFKRFTQVMVIVLGVVLSLLFNVDSISLAQYLWREPAIREVLVTQASNYQPQEGQPLMSPQETVQQFNQQFGGLHLPIGWDVKIYGDKFQPFGRVAAYNNTCQLFPRSGQYFGIPVFGSNIAFRSPPQKNQPILR